MAVLSAIAYLMIGFGCGGMFVAWFAKRHLAHIANLTSAARLKHQAALKANGILRRELFELRAQYEPTRDHGYGRSNG